MQANTYISSLPNFATHSRTRFSTSAETVVSAFTNIERSEGVSPSPPAEAGYAALIAWWVGLPPCLSSLSFWTAVEYFIREQWDTELLTILVMPKICTYVPWEEGSRSEQTTYAPSDAYRSAMHRPIPELEPVTMAILSWRRAPTGDAMLEKRYLEDGTYVGS